MLAVVHFAIVIVLALLPVAVPIVEYVQLGPPADEFLDLVALLVAALVVESEQQVIVAVVDKVAEVVVVPIECPCDCLAGIALGSGGAAI